VILLVDIGNSATKWAHAASPRRVRLVATTATTAAPAQLRRTLAGVALDAIRAIVVGSVVPDATAALRRVARVVCPHAVLLVPRYRDFARVMPCRVRPVLEPGADRLAGALALRNLRPLPACAVHVGTAVTLDVVAPDGAFVGGAILPGMALQLHALQTGTARLGAIATLPATGDRIGRTTADAMAFGIVRGVAWAVHGLLRDVARELAAPLRSVVISGGGAAPIARLLRQHDVRVSTDPLLALRGLACWYTQR